MKKYEQPTMEQLILEAEDVITLSVNNDYDPIISGESGNNPWATTAE